MTFLSFRAALLHRELDVLTLSVTKWGCFIDFDPQQFDRLPVFRVRPGERVHVTGPDVFEDHALAKVESVEPLIVRLTHGKCGDVKGVTKVMGRRRKRNELRSAA